MSRPVSWRLDERFEINDPGRRIDRRRAGDAHRVDVAARQRRERNRRPEAPLPYLRAGSGVERIDLVVFGGDDDARRAAPGRDPIEGLGIDRAVDRGVEAGVQLNGRRLRPGQRRRHVKPAAVGGAMIGDNARADAAPPTPTAAAISSVKPRQMRPRHLFASAIVPSSDAADAMHSRMPRTCHNFHADAKMPQVMSAFEQARLRIGTDRFAARS